MTPTILTRTVAPHPEAVTRADGGRCGVLIVKRNGQRLADHTRSWNHPSLCHCTDGGRNQALLGCPECDGTGSA